MPLGVLRILRVRCVAYRGTTQLRQLSNLKGDELVTRVLALIDEHKPLNVSLVGGDPLAWIPSAP